MERFGLEQLQLEFDPRYNIAPSQTVPIIFQQLINDSAQPRLVLETASWGLIPAWVRDPRLLRPMINARGETLVEKKTFRGAFAKRRCLIPADGFFEWTGTGKKRQPILFRVNKGELFSFAGLYEFRISPEGEVQRSCAIVTINANEKIAPFHDRMPVILTPDAEQSWLDSEIEDPALLQPLLKPLDNDLIDYFRVSTIVNSAKQDVPECVQPLPAEASEIVESAFRLSVSENSLAPLGDEP